MLIGCVFAYKDGPDGPSNYNRALPEKEETENSNSDVTSSSSDEISEEDEKEYFKPSGTHMLYCVLYR